MTISVAGVPVNQFSPGVFLNVIVGGSGSSAGVAQKRILLLANMIAADITGAAPAFTVHKGTASVEVPIQVGSASDADGLFGLGSEAARMVRRVFEMYPQASLWVCPVAESGGTAASQTLTFATNATSAATLRLYIGGQVFDVALNGTSTTPITPTAFATSVATAINAQSQLPVTAQFTLGVVTITAKHKGTKGNGIQCRAQWINGATTTEIAGAAAASGTGMTGAFGDATHKLAGGTTADSVTNSLAAILSLKFDRIVASQVDTVAVDALMAQVVSQAAATTQIRQQAICPSYDTLGAATTFATGRNGPRLQIVWHKNPQNPPEEVAAQWCAARSNGDALAGGNSDGDFNDPAANLDGTILRTILPQYDSTDLPSASDIDSALHNGLTPLVPASGNRTKCARSITSRSQDANGQQNYAVLDTSYMTVADYVADDLQSDLQGVFRNFKLGSDAADGTAPKLPKVTTPKGIKQRIATKLKFYETDLGILRNVDAHMGQLDVQENPLSPGRVDCEIPEETIPGLHIIAGNVRQVTPLG